MKSPREQMESLPVVQGDDVWDVLRRGFRKTMLEQEDWRGFKMWSVTQASLHSTDPRMVKREKKYLDGTRWKQHLAMHNSNDSTVASQMYNLALYEEVTGKKLFDGMRILEFGGGYGEMANIIYRDIDPDYYLVYDFPELGVLQRWYWKDICGMERIPLTVDELIRVTGALPDLFISLCGISEAPQPFKSEFLNAVWPSSVLLQYQGAWGGNDNIKIFTEFAESRFENIYHDQRPNRVGHQILIAWDPK